MMRGGSGQGLPGVFTTLTATGLVVSADVFTATGAVTQYAIAQYSIFQPASASQALCVAVYGNTSYSGTGGFTGAGHAISLLGDSVMNASGQTASLIIGTEGRLTNTNGTVTRGVGTLGSLGSNAVGKTITNWQGLLSQVSGNAGTVTNFCGVQVDVTTAFSGSIGEFRGFETMPMGGPVSGNFYGSYINSNIANITGIVFGHHVADQTTGSAAAAFSSAMTSGALKYSLYCTGSAQSAIVGACYHGATTSAGNGSIVEVTGVAELLTDRGIRFSNQTSAAAAQVGTLTNAPAAGNPGHWLKVKVGATNYAIPCWAG